MAALTAQFFRDYFGGRWNVNLSKNGEFQRTLIFNWPKTSGKFCSLGVESGLTVPPGLGFINDSNQIAIAGWRSDLSSWCAVWHNEFGGYGELKWTSTEVISGKTFFYGTLHECIQEGDDPTDHITMCEIIDQDHFKYTIQSYRKGLVEILAKRTKTTIELKKAQRDNQKKSLKNSDIE